MNKIILFLFTLIPTLLFAQDIKKISDKETNETFYVLKSDKTVKHGEYKKFNYQHKLLIKGFYKHGVKDSIWECFDLNGVPILTYDYTKSILLLNKPNDEDTKKYKILVSNHTTDTILSRPPIFFGGDELMFSEFIKNAQYPVSARENEISGTVFVSFTIDKYGKPSNYHVDTPLGYGLDEEAIRVFKSLPDNWMPGLSNGQPVDVEVQCPFRFQLN